MTHSDMTMAGTLTAASYPGGVPPNFRVQFWDERGGAWKLFASCKDLDRAENYLTTLEMRGLSSRVINFTRCPSAV